MDAYGSKALDAGLGFATGLLNKGVDSLFADFATDRAVKANKEIMTFQQGLQHQANLRAMSDKRHSLERAGFNLNAENGFQPVQAVPTSGLSSPKAEGGFDISSLGSLSQYQLQQEEKQLVSAQKKGQEIKNELDTLELNAQKEENYQYALAQNSVHLDSDGNVVIPLDDDADIQGGSLPNLSVTGSKRSATTKRGVIAKVTAVDSLANDLSKLSADTIHNRVQKAIDDGRMSPEWIEKYNALTTEEYANLVKTGQSILARMANDYAQASKARQEGKTSKAQEDWFVASKEHEGEKKQLTITEKGVEEFNMQLQKHGSVKGAVNKIFNPKSSLGERGAGVLQFIVAGAGEIAGAVGSAVKAVKGGKSKTPKQPSWEDM